MRANLAFVLSLIAVLSGFALSEENPVSKGLALTPPMGFNTWNKFGCNVSDELVRGMADAMVKSGMKDAGYQYVVIDDCWQVGRDAKANIVVDPQRFPSGHEGSGGLRSLAGAEVWDLFRCRFEDLPGAAGRAGP